MPTYRFVFHDSDSVPEVTVDLADDASATREALASARQTAADRILQGDDPRRGSIEVFDETQRLVCLIDFDTLVGARTI